MSVSGLINPAPSVRTGTRGRYHIFKRLVIVKALWEKDVIAARDGDPAAHSYDEIIFSYPGLFAISVYRIAHHLYEQGVPLIPRS